MVSRKIISMVSKNHQSFLQKQVWYLTFILFGRMCQNQTYPIYLFILMILFEWNMFILSSVQDLKLYFNNIQQDSIPVKTPISYLDFSEHGNSTRRKLSNWWWTFTLAGNRRNTFSKVSGSDSDIEFYTFRKAYKLSFLMSVTAGSIWEYISLNHNAEYYYGNIFSITMM